MKVRSALLRGINVGGRHALPMKELVRVLEGLGACDVHTYLNSGNAVFRSDANSASLAKELTSAIAQRHGFEPFVLILDQDDLEEAIRQNPFPEAETDPAGLHLGFLSQVPLNPDLGKLTGLKTDTERFKLIDKVFYLHAPEGVGRSKLAAAAEHALGVPMTDRNWKTVTKLRDMVGEYGERD